MADTEEDDEEEEEEEEEEETESEEESESEESEDDEESDTDDESAPMEKRKNKLQASKIIYVKHKQLFKYIVKLLNICTI